MAVGVAFVSRVAKNFQDYFVNVVVQRVGADLYSDGIRHSLALPFQTFEDQRSGETLGKLQKVRSDTEQFIAAFVNMVFTTLVGVIFVMIYAFKVHWAIAPAFLLTVPLLGVLSSVLSKRIKTIQKVIVAETTALAGATTESLRNIELVKSLGLAKQEELRLNATTEKILKLELKKVRYLRSLSFIQGTAVNFLRTCILFLMLYLIFEQADHGRAVLLAAHLLVLHLRPAAGAGERHQHLSRDRGVARELRGRSSRSRSIPKPANPVAVDDLRTLEFDDVSFTHATASAPALAGRHASTCERGQTVAFVGPSGAGKTTLVKLLVGLYRPARDASSTTASPATRVDLDRFRERIGFVTQDAQLFSGTIRENLLFVRPDATDDAVPRRAAPRRRDIAARRAPTRGSTR